MREVSNNVEHKIQVAFFEYVSYIPAVCNLVFAIPNGGLRHISVAKRLKAEGVKAGVADVFVSIASGEHHGLYIEFKYGKNKQTLKQKEFETNVKAQGYEYKVCYSVDEAIEVLNEYLSK